MNKSVKTAVFPMAGYGTRFFPITKVVAKELLPILDRPVIDYVVEEAKIAGIEKFVFVNSPNRSDSANYFKKNSNLEDYLRENGKHNFIKKLNSMELDPNSIFTVEQEFPLGLGHAIWCARDFINEDFFAVMLPDDLVIGNIPCIKELINANKQTKGNVLAAMEVPSKEVPKYGILDFSDGPGKLVNVKGLIEKPEIDQAPSNLAIIGRYILNKSIFEMIDYNNSRENNEIQLTDAIANTIGTLPLNGYRFSGRRFDCGHVLGALQASIAVSLMRKDLQEDAKNIISNEIR